LGNEVLLNEANVIIL